jgi:hypothetical protein
LRLVVEVVEQIPPDRILYVRPRLHLELFLKLPPSTSHCKNG